VARSAQFLIIAFVLQSFRLALRIYSLQRAHLWWICPGCSLAWLAQERRLEER
jgi:hypothetical protein